MKLTQAQKIGLVFFVASLFPAYMIANWRYETQVSNLSEMFEKEESLHKSTDKLIKNCETIAADANNGYGATHQICNQGIDAHARTESAMRQLEQDTVASKLRWYRDFGLTIAFVNLFAFALFRLNVYLKREDTI